MRATLPSATQAAVAAATLASAAFVTVSVPTAFAAPMTYVVDTTSDNPADGFTLREAIGDANTNAGVDTIEFADGLTGTITLASGELAVTDGLKIVGPGSADLRIDAAGASRVLNVNGAGVGFDLSGVTIANGGVLGSGGGIAFSGGDEIVLDDVDLLDNQASNQGGGLWVANPGDIVQIENSDIVNNTAGNSGAGIFVSGPGGAEVVLHNLLIEDNLSVNGNGGGVFVDKPNNLIRATFLDVIDNVTTNGNAGGAWFDGASVVVEDTWFGTNVAGSNFGGATINSNSGDVDVTRTRYTNNSAMDSGAGNVSSAADLFVTDTTVEANTSPGLGGLRVSAIGGDIDVVTSRFLENQGGTTGGLLVSSAADLDIVDATFDANVGSDHGGLAVTATPTQITGSTFSDNEAESLGGHGGGVYATGGTDVSTFNSTFDGNKAFDGGAIYAMGGSTIDLTHTTMVDNDAAGEAGGVYLVAGSDVVLRAAIVSDNTAPAFPDVNDPMVDIDHSILGDSTGVALNGAGFMVGVDPKLGPLADNGGLTLTRMPFPDSPAIDTGTAAILVESPFLDQRGRSRDGSPPDMGSVEVTTGSVEDDMGPVEDAQDESQIWVPTSPARFVDTRSNGETIDDLHEATGAFGNSEQRTITFAGRGDVPADAVGVIANVTAVNPAGKGFVTAHPCANPRPNSASLNYSAGVNLGNEIILGLDSGDACIFTSGATHLTVDVVGYIPAESPYSAITPARYADTRDVGITFDGMVQAGGAPGAVGQLTVPVAGRGTVPADAAAAVMYVSAVTPAGNGFVTVWNCDGPAPLASSLNHVPGVNRGNEIVADIGPDGDVCLFTSTSVDLTVDVVGYLPAGTNYESLDAPARLLDTREAGVTVDGTFVGEGQVGAGESVELIVGGRAGIPDLASTVTVNVTAVNPTAPGFVTVYDCVGQPPLASSLNYVPGVNGGNEIVASVNANGRLCLFTSAATHLTADATGYTSL